MSNPSRQNQLPAISQNAEPTYEQIFHEPIFRWDHPVEDWVSKDAGDQYRAVHTMMSGATFDLEHEQIEIKLYAQRWEPLPHQVDSDINFWRSFNIETLNRRTGEFMFYTYRPKEYLNSRIPEAEAGSKFLDNKQMESFHSGLTFWQNTTHNAQPLSGEESMRLRQYVTQSVHNPQLTQSMVNHWRTVWPDSYPADHPPQDGPIKKRLKDLGKFIYNKTIG